jgi:hypothetical protein
VIGEGLAIEGRGHEGEDEVVVHGTRARLALTTTGRGHRPAQAALSGATISASSLSIAGQVTGNVTAQDRVDLQAGGRLVGDVKSARLTIADGASFKGSVDMEV